MNLSKTTSIILCHILILSVIAFAEDPTTDPEENWDQFIEETTLENLDSKVSSIIADPAKTNKLLSHIKEQLKDPNYGNKEKVEEIIEEIVTKKSPGDMSFDIGENSEIQDISLEDNTLNLKIKDQNFKVPLDSLPESVVGIETTKDGIRYKTKDGNKVDITNPDYSLEEKDDKLLLKGYIGADGQPHEFLISFTEEGRVSTKPNGEIEFSGGAQIYDPKTQTTFSLKDTKGKPGYINFYKNGHIIKPIGNTIQIKRAKEDLNLDIKKSNENGMFVLASEDINKDSYSDFPPGIDKTNSMLIDSKNKNIYLPEDENAIGYIHGTGYKLFGLPNLPQGGVLMDGGAGFGGGNIFSNNTRTSVPPNQGGTGGGGGVGGGGIGSMSPMTLLMIGGSILGGVLLMSMMGGDGEEEEYDTEIEENTQEINYTNDSLEPSKQKINSYKGPSGEVSTGRSATSNTREIQSLYK
jgi:hypothetical protein